MGKISTTIRTDQDVKQQAQRIFSGLGMDMSTAVNIFFHQVVRINGLPFEVTMDAPKAETLAALQEVQQMKKDPHIGKTYTNVDDMMKELLA